MTLFEVARHRRTVVLATRSDIADTEPVVAIIDGRFYPGLAGQFAKFIGHLVWHREPRHYRGPRLPGIRREFIRAKARAREGAR